MKNVARPASASARSARSAQSAQSDTAHQASGRQSAQSDTARSARSTSDSAQQGAAHSASAPAPPAADHLVTLQVAAPSHGSVHVTGLARFFPAHTVHVQRSTAVVAGDNCELRSRDHYHVHRVSVSLDPLLKQGSPGRAALHDLLEDHTPSGIARFQQTMRHLAGPTEHPDTQTSLPVQVRHNTWVTSATGVQYGDESRMNLNTHYLVEESELPIVELLAQDKDLVRSLLGAVDEPQAGPATEKFLRDALHSAGCVDDLALLDNSRDLSAQDTTIFGLFGVDIVHRASAATVGTGNQLRKDMQVHRAGVRTGTILADLDRIRQQNPVPGPAVARPRPAPQTQHHSTARSQNAPRPSGWSAPSRDDRSSRPGRSLGPF